jgi:hypothetical protein
MSANEKLVSFKDLYAKKRDQAQAPDSTSEWPADQTQTRPVPEKYQTQPVPDPDQTRTSTITGKVTEPAPARDYNRRANSLDREALPAGLFPGSSKKIYDALYLRTRGAVKPARTLRATRRDLMKWTGIKNIKTVNAHIAHLQSTGLISLTKMVGEHEGSVYEVFLPEEMTSTRPVPDPTQTRAVPEPNQKLDSDQYQKTVRVGSGNLVDYVDTYAVAKTSFKTNTERTDDEAFAELVALLGQASREVTGKESTATEAGRWKEVAELLVTELKVAASRTTVTSAPAFLAEHLRRRLRKADAGQIEREVGEASTKQAAGASKPELTADQIQEQVNLMTGLMRDGAEMRELEEQFAANFRPAQWHMIRSIALAQANTPATKPKDSQA